MQRPTPNMQTPDAEGWRPEAGDMIVGTVEDVDIGWSDFRGEYPIITIRPDKDKSKGKVTEMEAVKIHCFHDVLYNRVLTLRPVPGETVGIQFHGKFPHKTKPTQTVSRYTFKVAGRTADASGLYDRMRGDRQPRQQQQPQQGFTPRSDVPVDDRDFQTQLPADAGKSDDDDIPF